MPPFLLPIISMLTDKGLNALSDFVGQGADKAIETIAQKTGIDLKTTQQLTPDEKQKLIEFQDSADFKRLQLQFDEKKLYADSEKVNLATITTAQDMYKVKNEQADKIADSVYKYNLPLITGLVAINVLCVLVIKDTALIALIATPIGMAIQKAWDERATILTFYFGSSLGSRNAQAKLLGDK